MRAGLRIRRAILVEKLDPEALDAKTGILGRKHPFARACAVGIAGDYAEGVEHTRFEAADIRRHPHRTRARPDLRRALRTRDAVSEHADRRCIIIFRHFRRFLFVFEQARCDGCAARIHAALQRRTRLGNARRRAGHGSRRGARIHVYLPVGRIRDVDLAAYAVHRDRAPRDSRDRGFELSSAKARHFRGCRHVFNGFRNPLI